MLIGTKASEILMWIQIFSLNKYISKCRLQNDGHSVSATLC